MGSLSRNRYAGGSRQGAYRNFRASPELVERARAATKRWEEETGDRAESGPDQEALSRIEAAVDDGLRRIERETKELLSAIEKRCAELEEELARRSSELIAANERQAEVADRLATEFSRLYSRFHPASSHLTELQARVKSLAAELTSEAPAAGKTE
jgi:chromosome segregation ATPase